AALVGSDPFTSTKTTSQIQKAKTDLINLAERIESIKREERSVLEKKLEKQAQDYNKKLHDMELQTRIRFTDPETGWRKSFNDEQEKIIESYRKKLEAELETQSEIINR